jgi:SAM-dependent methyltransferase
MTPALLEQPTAPLTEWFESWFDSPYYHKLYAYRDDSEAQRFIDALVARLDVAPGADALDLGCGAGRHARQLAAHGLHVTGLDLSASSLRQARKHERPGLAFRRHDMRVPFGTDAFDDVFSFFTSFGYFADPFEHLVVVSNVAEALRPGGRLVLDYLNVAAAQAKLTPSETKIVDEVTYHLTRWADARAFHKRIVVDDPANRVPVVFTERVARLTLADFDVMFGGYGLVIEQTFGDYQLSPFDRKTSPRLIVVARKSETAAGLLPLESLAHPAQGLG